MGNLSPCPLPPELVGGKGGEFLIKEGLTPLLDSPKTKESQREAKPLLQKHFPLSF